MFSGLTAQSDYYHQELSITTENDVYLLQNTDRYYSNGALIHFRFIPEKRSFLGIGHKEDTKRIIELELSQKFFTPKDLTLTDIVDYDRPYAGWLYTGLTISDFPKANQALTYGAELGVVGDISGADGFQTWYHRNFGFPVPQGWDFQIRNELVFNLKASYSYQFPLLKNSIDLITTSSAVLGTGFINAMQQADFRFGKLQSLDESAFKNAIIGRRRNGFERHAYFFLGYGAQWVGHNITVQGSLWKDNSPHTEDIYHSIQRFRVGWAASSVNTTFKMTYNWLSEEVKGAKVHSYIGFELLIRFRPRNF
ncbi:MAG: lipid A deacylase LpxR family protein [Roseivirga sp.]